MIFVFDLILFYNKFYMENYYKILEISQDSNNEDIKKAYKLKIKEFNHLPFLNKKQKLNVKKLKEAYFVLLDEKLREKYDLILESKKKESRTQDELLHERIFEKKNKYNINLEQEQILVRGFNYKKKDYPKNKKSYDNIVQNEKIFENENGVDFDQEIKLKKGLMENSKDNKKYKFFENYNKIKDQQLNDRIFFQNKN